MVIRGGATFLGYGTRVKCITVGIRDTGVKLAEGYGIATNIVGRRIRGRPGETIVSTFASTIGTKTFQVSDDKFVQL